MNKNKTILITGAAKRLGKEIAILFSKMGYNIAIHYHSSETEARILQKDILKNNVKSAIFQYDLSKIENCQKLISDVQSEFQKIDILINNSSIFVETGFSDINEEVFDQNFDINYKSIFFLSQYFSKNNSGNIINILDSYISRRSKKFFTYINSKKSLKILTEDMALELAPKIRVNAVAPGAFLPTYEFGVGDEYIAKRANKAPLDRYTNINDIFQTMLFFINNEFLTGQTVYVDGGEHLMTM
jgi:pteridine reductase